MCPFFFVYQPDKKDFKDNFALTTVANVIF